MRAYTAGKISFYKIAYSNTVSADPGDDYLATCELAQLVEIELVESQQSFPLDLIPYLYDTIGIMKKI